MLVHVHNNQKEAGIILLDVNVFICKLKPRQTEIGCNPNKRVSMMKRVLLSLSLLAAMQCSVARAAANINNNSPTDNIHGIVLDDTTKSSLKERLTELFDSLSTALGKNLSTVYNKTAGRVYTPACLNNHDGRKALVVGTLAATVVYLTYAAWKKYNASKDSAQDDALTSACIAAKSR